jgi:hypothetical protein
MSQHDDLDDIGELPRQCVYSAPCLLAVAVPDGVRGTTKEALEQWRWPLVAEVEKLVRRPDYVLVGRPLMGCVLIASLSPALLLLSSASLDYKSYVVGEALPEDYIGEEIERYQAGHGDMKDCVPFLLLEKRLMRAFTKT